MLQPIYRSRCFTTLCALSILSGAPSAARGQSDASDASPRPTRTNLLVYRNAQGHLLPVKSIRDWQQRRAEILRGAQQIMGPLPGKEKRCPLAVKVEEEVD